MLTTASLSKYYKDDRVRNRIFEFLGGDRPDNLTCRFITADGFDYPRYSPRPPEELLSCLDAGMEIGRSLWDRRYLIAHLDIEYVNFDFPSEAYLHPERAFDLQVPVVAVAEELLHEYGIFPLHLLSGRGHHFAWQIPLESPTFESLAEIGRGSRVNENPRHAVAEFRGERVPDRLVTAFSGLGMVMELLAHEIKEHAASQCAVPVELTAVEVGPGKHGREMISLDISEYGDPLSSRAVHVPFSVYLKPWQQHYFHEAEFLQNLAPIFFFPLQDMAVSQGLEIMRDMEQIHELAGHFSTHIPVQEKGMNALICKYLGSSLRLFHEWFYSHIPHSPENWQKTYDCFPMETLPPCAQMILNQPNDLLLRPWGMRLVVRSILALGWHPRHIAGLLASKFERDFHWGDQWENRDPSMRADFYTRIFAGLFVTRRDNLVDFNCQSAKEQKSCSITNCSENLTWYRQSAMTRRHYGYLAHRPFNRLFSSKEHL